MIRPLLIASAIALSAEPSIGAAPVPLNTTTPVAVDRLRVNNPAVVSMTWIWHFELQHGRSPSVKGVLPESYTADDVGFAATGMDDSAWKTIPVPANWEIECFSRPTFQDRGNNPSDDIGLYRRSVEVPAKFAGQRVLWHFDGVYDGAEVFVNGQRVGYHESGFTAFDIDVTDALQPGKSNLFAVRVYKLTPTSNLDKGDFWCLGGIYRDNYLLALPPLHIDDVTLTTDLDAQYKNPTLNAQDRIVGAPGTRVQLTAELYGLDGKKVSMPPMQAAGEIGADGARVLTLAAPVKTPKLWSATAVESGVKFILPASARKISWLRDSRWSEYPPDHIGEPTGTVASDDISFRSSKRDLRWMVISGAGKYSLVALNAGAPLAARALTGANGTTFYLTSAIAAPSGELSLNSVPGYDIRLTPDAPVGGAFRLRVAAQR